MQGSEVKGFYWTQERPFSAGRELPFHRKCQSKEIIKTLSRLNLCITYEKILEIETGIANSIFEKMQNNDGA